MAFGVVLIVLITLLVVAVLVAVVGYIVLLVKKARQTEKRGENQAPSVAIAPDPDMKK